MHALNTRFTERNRASFTGQTSFDRDVRPGELSLAIARAQTGDQAAIRYLYLRFSGNVYGYTRSIVADKHAAEDVTQQVFARLITAIGSYEPRGVPFSAWLLRIAHNMAIDHIRRQRADPSELEWLSAVESDGSAELSMELRSAMSCLPDAQREVVVLRHVLGWTPPEIAEKIGKSEEAVHGLHHRGRRALKAELTRRDVGPLAIAA